MTDRLPTAARYSAIASAAMIAQQVAGKATRDALYLSWFPASSLPPIMAASACLSCGLALWLARALHRHTPARVVPVSFAGGAGILLGIWALGFVAPRAAAIALYVETALFGAVAISAFWSLINEAFDPHIGRRAVNAIASGGTLGGLLGGFAAYGLARHVAVTTMLPLLAALSLVSAWGTRRVPARERAASEVTSSVGAAVDGSLLPLRVLRTAPYLRTLAALVAIGALSSGLLDYALSVQAARAFAQGAALLSFFSLFWLVVGVLSFAVQLLFGRLTIEKVGLATNVTMLPVIVAGGGLACLLAPGLVAVSLVRGAEATHRNSLFRGPYEMLYAPLPEGVRRATKTVIDVAFDRLGTLAAAALTAAALWASPDRSDTVVLAAVVLSGMTAIVLCRPLYQRYVGVLEESLKSSLVVEHALSAAPDAAAPPLSVRGPTPSRPSIAPPTAFAVDRRVARDVQDLLGADPVRVKAVLSRAAPLPAMLVPFAVVALGDPVLRLPASEALSRSMPAIVGQLADALADRSTPFDVRRRIPRVLAAHPSQLSADALLRGATDERFEVRYECGKALLKVTAADPQIVTPRDRVIEVLKLEVATDRELWEREAAPEIEDDEDADTTLRFRQDRHDRFHRSLEHVFTLLALHLDRAALVLAFKALHHEDDRVRGTALEYLETVLPAEIRETVWPYLGEERPQAQSRASAELVSELERSTAAGGVA